MLTFELTTKSCKLLKLLRETQYNCQPFNFNRFRLKVAQDQN
jgi:hypothetical protein